MTQKIKTAWDLSPIYKNPNDPQIEKDRKTVFRESYKFINKWKDRSDYLNDPKILKIALDEYSHWIENYGPSGKEGYYLFLQSSLDENDTKLKAKIQKLTDFSLKISNDIQFFEMRVSKIDKKEQPKFLNNPLLKDYQHFLKRSFESAKHLLTEPEEKILNLQSGPAFGKWVEMVSGLVAKEEAVVIDEDGKKKKKTVSEIGNMVLSYSKKTRKSAILALDEIAEKYVDVAESELNAILEYKKISDNLRGFTRPDQARHISDDIDSAVVDTMVKSVKSRLDIPKKYYELKAKLLGLKKLEPWDRSAPYGKVKRQYTFEQATNIVKGAFDRIDKDFSNMFVSFLSNGQIDVYSKKGKTGGAFCVYDHIKKTPHYILLNFNGSVRNITTIAHEMGHAINHELIRRNQNGLNDSSSLATAEVASIFMEDFAFQELIEKSKDEDRLSLLMQDIEESLGSTVKQISAYSFEQDLHSTHRKEGYLSKDRIRELFNKNMNESLGKTAKITKIGQDKWVIWPHFRMFFYVYSYSSGLLISKALQRKFKKDPNFISEIKEFLSAGSSDSPSNIFKKMGINIRDEKFWLEGLQEIDDQVKEATILAKKLGKI